MNLISIADLDGAGITRLLDRADELKRDRPKGASAPSARRLEGKSLAMIFEKASTRTRVSLEVAMRELGGHALYLSSSELQLGRGETVADTARVLSRFVHGITARVYDHRTVVSLAEHASVPVVNALSDLEHPCQILADLMTIRERFGRLRGLQVAWIGDGNNVCNSLILASAIMGMEMSVASPPGYEVDSSVVEKAGQLGHRPRLVAEPEEAAAGADVLVTDTWVSMGDEAEEAERLRVFGRYQINSRLLKLAGPKAIVMHCLPAHRGQELTDEVMDGPQSAVFDEAENRLHTSKAILEWLMG
ncbi:MAG: ornithine carbamoyltransferase [Methanosarcinales archaeon]|nr:ornithine carbamoyltransferase [Methanosarcinales archaeon]